MSHGAYTLKRPASPVSSGPMDESFGHWLAGFIDGEGCFLIRQQRRRNWCCQFAISLRDDDAPILTEIAERTGIGWLTEGSNGPGKGRKAAWIVTSKADCLALVELLERFPLRAKKARDFAVWREAVLAWQGARRGGGPFDWTTIEACRDRLAEARKHPEAA